PDATLPGPRRGGQLQLDPILRPLLGLERLLNAAVAGRAVQVEAALALGRLPEGADEIDLPAGDGPPLDLLGPLVERLELADVVRPLLEGAVDDQVPRRLERGGDTDGQQEGEGEAGRKQAHDGSPMADGGMIPRAVEEARGCYG